LWNRQNQLRRDDEYKTPLVPRREVKTVGGVNESMIDAMFGSSSHLEYVNDAIDQNKRVNADWLVFFGT